MNALINRVLLRFFNRQPQMLNHVERRVVESVVRQAPLARDVQNDFCDERTFGEQVADRVAAFGGSWTFIFIFAGVLICWVILNSIVLSRRGAAFDPYPYILLNLFLSMLAALQAPVIMMSQNRQAATDRLAARHDYEINLKAELEIRLLQEKIDELRDQKWLELIEMQQRQIELLTDILNERATARSAENSNA